MTRRTFITASVAVLGAGAIVVSCAAPARRAAAPGYQREVLTSDGHRTTRASGWGTGEWERYQQAHQRTLAELAQAPLRKTPPAPRNLHPQTGPSPRRPTRFKPPPDPPVAIPGGGSSNPGVSTKQTLRCRRICRHVQAICHAAFRVCRIASRLDEPPAHAACRRSRTRCTDARTLAGRTCAPCGNHGQRARCRDRRRHAARPFWPRWLAL